MEPASPWPARLGSNDSERSAATAVPSEPRSSALDATLNSYLFPSDSWTSDGTYWASLPSGERRAFVSSEQGKENKMERQSLWNDFKSDPMLPAIKYWRNYVMPGMGLFTEGYVLFSISK